MGFGSVFIGFVLLLNIGYYAYTDLLAALLISLGLSRLGRLCRPFFIGLILSAVYALIGAGELFFELSPLFMLKIPEGVTSAFSCARYACIGALTLFVLLGIRSLASEVGLQKLKNRCEYTLVYAPFLYLCSAILEFPRLFSHFDPSDAALIGGVVLLLSFLFGCINLHTVYTAYARICMPDDLDMPERPSRFGFVNEYRQKKAEEERLALEERMQRMKAGHANKTQKGKRK